MNERIIFSSGFIFKKSINTQNTKSTFNNRLHNFMLDFSLSTGTIKAYFWNSKIQNKSAEHEFKSTLLHNSILQKLGISQTTNHLLFLNS